MKPTVSAAPRPLRCAIYTRKSSDEGLDQAFNSLHAQREACEAYAFSQAGEGWIVLPAGYDDGGWSGGAMDRPALRKLLDDVEAGLIDIVVVYKVDRLTRSLADFAKIVETLDRHGASFVSVTQAFNTTTSMGRLTLNVLLSFAQFEREVTGERIRDKIAASKAKGMWMGGILPLGYDPPVDLVTRALVINPAEADQVRMVFSQYLQLRSVHELQAWLRARSIRSKRWMSTRGRMIGGVDFSRGALFHLLSNRTYLGEIPHKELTYPGAHEAIIDEETFAAVQAKLKARSRRGKPSSPRVAAMTLKGLLFDADGVRMGPTFAYGRNKKLYRYYVADGSSGDDPDDERISRVPAEPVEGLVRGAVERLARISLGGADTTRLRRYVDRIELHPTSVQIVIRHSAVFIARSDPDQELATLARRLAVGETLRPEAAGEGRLRLTIPCRMKVRGGRTWLALPDGQAAGGKPQSDCALIAALRSAHATLSELGGAPVGAPEDAVLAQAPDSPYERRVLRLAFLAPDIQRAILEGRQPAGLTLQRLVLGAIPASWDAQRAEFC